MVLLKERFLFLVVTFSLKFLCLKSTSKYLQVSTLLFSFRILWSCVFSYQNQPYSGLIVHVGIKQYKFCLFIHWFCTWLDTSLCILMCVGILLIYSRFNLYFLLCSLLYIPDWTYTGNNNWPIKATWLLSEIVEGPSIWTFWYHLVWIQNPLLWPTLFSYCFVVIMLIIDIATTWLFINNSTASSCELSTCTGFCFQNYFLSYIVPNF